MTPTYPCKNYLNFSAITNCLSSDTGEYKLATKILSFMARIKRLNSSVQKESEAMIKDIEVPIPKFEALKVVKSAGAWNLFRNLIKSIAI